MSRPEDAPFTLHRESLDHLETRLLGSILHDDTGALEAASRVAALVSPEDFSDPDLRAIFQAILGVIARGAVADVQAVGQELKKAGNPALPLVAMRCYDAVVGPTNAVPYAEELARHATTRHVRDDLLRGLDAIDRGDVEVARRLALRIVADSAPNGQAPTNVLSALGQSRTLEELKAETDTAEEWVVEGLIAAGRLTLLAGLSKGGKTTILSHILASVIEGREVLGKPTKKADVLYLSEMGDKDTAAYAEKFGLRCRFYTRREIAKRLEFRVVVDAAAAEAQRTGCSLIVLDTGKGWGNLGPGEGNDPDVIAGLMRDIKATMETTPGLTWVVVLHHRKSEGAHGTRISGAHTWTGEADVVLEYDHVSERKGDRRRRLTALGRPAGLVEEMVVELRQDGLGFDLVSDTTSPEAKEQSTSRLHEDACNRILSHLRIRPGRTGAELEDEILGRSTVVRDARKNLLARQLIEVRRVGKRKEFYVSEEGSEGSSQVRPEPGA